MNYSSSRLKRSLYISATLLITGLLFSCENKLDLIPKSDLLTLPSLTVRDFETIFTDSGRIQLVLTSPIMEQYENAEVPYSEFKLGILVKFHDGREEPVGSVSAKYAKYTKSNNVWELRDSVVVINEAKEMLETEILFWDQAKDKIYTDRFVKITSTDQVIQGFGFESDSKLQRRRIRKVSATIYQ
jgi:LPS export ABC transporter protein LptC